MCYQSKININFLTVFIDFQMCQNILSLRSHVFRVMFVSKSHPRQILRRNKIRRKSFSSSSSFHTFISLTLSFSLTHTHTHTLCISFKTSLVLLSFKLFYPSFYILILSMFTLWHLFSQYFLLLSKRFSSIYKYVCLIYIFSFSDSPLSDKNKP